MKLAKRISSFAPSATMAISAMVTELKAQGRDIIGFAAGEPDFDVPDFVKEAAIQAIRDGKNKYSAVAGLAEAKQAVIDYVKKDLGLHYQMNEVILSCGAKHSLYNISQALYEPGDEVLIFAPYWVSYPDQVSLAGAKPVIIDCKQENDFNPDPADIAKKINGNTKAIILNSPSNPTGAVFSDEVIREIGKLAVENDLLLVSDEIYDKILYDGAKAPSPATIGDDVKKKTLLVNGFSKTWSMTGWRLGYTLGSPEIVKAMGKIQGQSTSNPVTPVQVAAITALSDISFIEERVVEFKKRRDTMVAKLNEIEGVSCNMPKGAFYAFPDFSDWVGKSIGDEIIKDSVHLTNLLIEHAGIAPVPGSAFGAENYQRFSYAMSMEPLVEGLTRLADFGKKLK